ncbi:MAG: hypothetical protein K1X86_10270 [Ignavibacteria bacterium]|nr:hypothetical protein [Ignavibacteria bacterium]
MNIRNFISLVLTLVFFLFTDSFSQQGWLSLPQNAGSYAVDFNSTEYNLPSGIYFYTLNAGDFKETRKMVLIK